jgi:hypothetical protein
MCFLFGAGRIACKDVGICEAFSCSAPPSPAFYKLREIERRTLDTNAKKLRGHQYKASSHATTLESNKSVLGMLGLMKGRLERSCCRGQPTRIA